jgi:hypothetical protein
MYLQLDDIRFTGRFGPSALDYRYVERIAKTPLLNGKAALLRVGTELVEYRLDLRLHTSFVDVAQALTRLREKQIQNRVCTFIDGNGELIGEVVILSLEVNERDRTTTGTLIHADVQLVLVEYAAIAVNDQARGRDFGNALALAENDVIPVRIEQLPGSEAASLVIGLSGTIAEIRATELAATLAVTAPPAQRVRNLTRVASGAKKVQAGARAGLALLNRGLTLAAQVPALVTQFETMANQAAILSDAAERGDLSAVSASSGGLLDLASSALDTTRPLNRLVILRRI